jgi:hypothetical protein
VTPRPPIVGANGGPLRLTSVCTSPRGEATAALDARDVSGVDETRRAAADEMPLRVGQPGRLPQGAGAVAGVVVRLTCRR